MNLFDFVKPECVAIDDTIRDKAAALQRIAELAHGHPALAQTSLDAIRAGLEQREAVGTTGFGGRIAIPHCRLGAVEAFVVGLLVVPGGAHFEAMDGQSVQLFAFIIGPERESNEHIRILSSISQVLVRPEAVREILAEKSPETVRESFLRHAGDEVDPEGREGRHLFHVFIEAEDVFRDILQIFASLAWSTTVIETRNVSAYLSKLPLFAGFWSDDPLGFSRAILALVPKKLTNETMRRIERITGPLDQASGVLVTVQEVFYSAGRLES